MSTYFLHPVSSILGPHLLCLGSWVSLNSQRTSWRADETSVGLLGDGEKRNYAIPASVGIQDEAVYFMLDTQWILAVDNLVASVLSELC